MINKFTELFFPKMKTIKNKIILTKVELRKIGFERIAEKGNFGLYCVGNQHYILEKLNGSLYQVYSSLRKLKGEYINIETFLEENKLNKLKGK